ncbi:Retrovirus-related pol polyprotein from transposon opus, partial [Thalictrum thalictroides]
MADIQEAHTKLLQLPEKLDKNHQEILKPNSAQKVATTTLLKYNTEPLHEDLLLQEPPQHFIPPKFNLYDGSGDPLDYILQFKTNMALWPKCKDIFACLFQASLKGSAMDWYHRLPERSITSYDQLESLFVTQYIHNKRRQTEVTALFRCKQQPTESTKKYMDRFKKECLKADSPDENTCLMAFASGVNPTSAL